MKKAIVFAFAFTALVAALMVAPAKAQAAQSSCVIAGMESRLAVGMRARVVKEFDTFYHGIPVYEDPEKSAPFTATYLPPGAEVEIIEGPICNGDHWEDMIGWKVRGDNNLVGWTLEASNMVWSDGNRHAIFNLEPVSVTPPQVIIPNLSEEAKKIILLIVVGVCGFGINVVVAKLIGDVVEKSRSTAMLIVVVMTIVLVSVVWLITGDPVKAITALIGSSTGVASSLFSRSGNA